MGGIFSIDPVHVEFKGSIDDGLSSCLDSDGWGFAIWQDGRSAYIPVGTRDELERDILKRHDNLPWLVLDALRQSSDEMSEDFINFLLDSSEGEIINGQAFISEKVKEAFLMGSTQ